MVDVVKDDENAASIVQDNAYGKYRVVRWENQRIGGCVYKCTSDNAENSATYTCNSGLFITSYGGASTPSEIKMASYKKCLIYSLHPVLIL